MSILDPSYMIDLGGIDVIQSQGVAIPGLYQKLLDNIGPCGNPLIYNWKFNGVFIPPQFVEPVLEDDAIYINDIYVSSDDVVHIPSIEPSIVQLNVSENGTYLPTGQAAGFSPVVVDVQPTIVQLNVSENGTYEVPEGTDGFNPVYVSVQGGTKLTPIWNKNVNFGRGNDKLLVAFEIGIDESLIPLYATGWDASLANFYNSENINGAYFGVEAEGVVSGYSAINFFLGRYSGQNATRTVTVEYQAVENGNWIEIEDILITSSFPYPYSKVSIDISSLSWHSIRGRHYKDVKSGGNNVVFFGLTLT